MGGAGAQLFRAKMSTVKRLLCGWSDVWMIIPCIVSFSTLSFLAELGHEVGCLGNNRIANQLPKKWGDRPDLGCGWDLRDGGGQVRGDRLRPACN